MSDNPNTEQSESSSAGTQNTEHMIPKSRFDDINSKYRALEKELKALQDAQAEREAQAQAQRDKELAEQSRYKELYENALVEIEKLKAVEGEVSRYRESFESTLQSRLDQIPDDKQHLIPEFEDPIRLSAWLDKALPDLVTPAKPTAPKLDGSSGQAGSTGDGTQKPLSPDQSALAEYARQSGFALNSDRLRQFARNPSKQTDLDKQE